MNRRAIVYTTLATSLGLGLLVLAKREQMGPLLGETTERLSPEKWREGFESQLQAMEKRIDETKRMLEMAAKEAQLRTRESIKSALDRIENAITSVVIATAATGLLTAVLIFIYAPEREQQERIWRSIKTFGGIVGDTVSFFWQRAAEIRQSPS